MVCISTTLWSVCHYIYLLFICLTEVNAHICKHTQCKSSQTSDHPISSIKTTCKHTLTHALTFWSYVRRLCLYTTVSRCEYLQLYNCAERLVGKKKHACSANLPWINIATHTGTQSPIMFSMAGYIFMLCDEPKRVC